MNQTDIIIAASCGFGLAAVIFGTIAQTAIRSAQYHHDRWVRADERAMFERRQRDSAIRQMDADSIKVEELVICNVRLARENDRLTKPLAFGGAN